MKNILTFSSFLTFVVGDTATTIYGILTNPMIYESNELLVPIIAISPYAIIVYKILIFGAFIGVSSKIPDPHSYGIPIGLTLLGTVITVYNLTVIF